MDILVCRNSVCLGDDMEDHSLTLPIDHTTTCSDVFYTLLQMKYFPHISGNDVVWTLRYEDEDLLSWKTLQMQMYSRFGSNEPAIVSVHRWKSIPVIMFQYHSSPLQRAKHIFSMFHGDMSAIQKAGFMPEYQSYAVSKTVEEAWFHTDR